MRSNNRKNDDFDFGLDEEIEDEQPAKPVKPKGVPAEDFFDLDDDLDTNKGKLPVINQRSSAKLIDNKPKINKPADTKLEALSKKDVTYDYLDEELDDYRPPVSKVSPVNKAVVNTPKKVDSYQPKYEEPEEEKPQPEPEPEPEPEEQENYGEDFDDYGEDFEEFHDDAKKPESPKKVEKPPEKKISVKQPISKQVNKEQGGRAKTISKQQTLKKSNSRASLKSNKSSHSQARARTNLAVGQQIHKYEQQVSNSFPQLDLQKLSLDNLNKLNDRVRAMIRRLNDQLNDILTKNTLLLKAKKQGKQEKGTEDRLKVLHEEKKNNQKILERMDEELKRMKYREGKIKDEDYQVEIHKRIMAMTQNKKELEKEIVKLKFGVENEGKRLTSGAEKKQISSQNNFKTEIVYQKKQELRLTELLGNLDKKLQEMQPKYSQAESKLNILYKQAVNQGIGLGPKTGLKAKYDELSKKQEDRRKGLAMMEGNVKSKKEKTQQQIVLLRRSCQNMDAQIKNVYSQIDHVIEECRNVINNAKVNPKITKNLEQSLDNISRSLVANDPMEFDRISRNSVHSEKPRMMSADRVKKQETHDDFLPLNPKKLAKNVQQKPTQPLPVHKPNFKKKDLSLNNAQDKNAQRIWKDQDLKQPPMLHQKTIPVVPQQQAPQIVQEAKQVAEDGSKPKFMLKKKGNNASVNNINDADQQPVRDIPREEPVKESKPSIQVNNQDEKKTIQMDKPFGNRMMRLRKNNDKVEGGGGYNPTEQPKQEIQAYSSKPQVQAKPALNTFGSKVSSQNKLALDNPIIEHKSVQPVVEQQPIVGPRRIMLRKRGGEEESSGGGGYNPNFVKKEEPPAPAPAPNPALRTISLKDDPSTSKPTTNPYAPPTQPQKSPFTNPYAPKQQDKPTPISNPSNPYAPRPKQPIDIPVRDVPRQSILNPSTVKQQPTVLPNTSNPYAPATNSNAPPIRQREGRLKKNKIEIAKEKITNIYQAAEEQVVNEFIPEVKPVAKQIEQPVQQQPAQQKQHKHEELDLNALLGISNKPKDDPEDELVFGKNKKVEDKKVAPVRKRQEDFFGGFDV